MNCRDVIAVLEGEACSSDAALEEHLAHCESCAARVNESVSHVTHVPPLALRAAKADGAEIDPLWASLSSAVAEERGFFARLRSLSTPLRLVLAFASVGAMAAVVLVFLQRVDLDAYPVGRLLGALALYAVLLGVLVYEHLSPLQRPRASLRAYVVVAAVAMATPFAVALLPPPTLAHAVSTEGQGQFCLVIGGVVGGLLIFLLRGLDRDEHRGPGASLVAAAAAGTAANFALEFYCPLLDRMHLLTIHAPLGVVLLGLYALVRSTGRKASAARRRPIEPGPA